MNPALKIRAYIDTKDEQNWINIYNQAMAEFPDITSLTLEDLEAEFKNPDFDFNGRFIAECDGQPVGTVHAFIDPMRVEKKGDMDGPRVVTNFRRKHIGTALAKMAFQNLRDRGINLVQARNRDENIAGKYFLESLGFQMNRVFSRMRRPLDELPTDVGENQEVKIIQQEPTDENLILQNHLLNESMKGHYNYRVSTLEEARYYEHEMAKLGVTFYDFVAYQQDEPVGILIASIDRKENEQQKKNKGWLNVLGVLKNHRGKGIGKALLIRGLKIFRELGMEEVELGVDDENSLRAIKIYQKLGFKVVRKISIYNKNL